MTETEGVELFKNEVSKNAIAYMRNVANLFLKNRCNFFFIQIF